MEMLDQPLSMCLDRALARLSQRCRHAPASAAALHSWAERLSPTGHPRGHFDGTRAVMFVLPWWLEKRIRTVPDTRFQERVVESTVNAYYFVRLIDNVMDGHDPDDRALLPLLGILHSNVTRAYAACFPADSVFWQYFDRHWSATAEAALREKTLTSVSAADFKEVAARKTSGVKVPLSAVCCRYARLDLLEPWCTFHDRFARWQQMMDDTFDWMRDLRDGNRSFFLSEGLRRKRKGESISAWVVRRGFAWGLAQLEDAMLHLCVQAKGLESPELVRFLEYRAADVREHGLELRSQLEDLARVADVFEPIAAESTTERPSPNA